MLAIASSLPRKYRSRTTPLRSQTNTLALCCVICPLASAFVPPFFLATSRHLLQGLGPSRFESGFPLSSDISPPGAIRRPRLLRGIGTKGLRSQADSKAYLVGSGIGGIDYLTVRAMGLLQVADVVVYDALAHEELLSLVKPSCKLINVGKRGGSDSSTPQAEIDKLLVELTAEKGKTVVRLKSGDPFVFGRSRSEVAALQEAGVAFEVVPGLTSAIAGPLVAGVAVTDPELSKSFAVLSGFDKQKEMPDNIAGLRSIDTLIFLMSGSRIGAMSEKLIAGGFSRDTPVVVVKWAGHVGKQRIWRGDLETIDEVTRGEELSPAVIVVGRTAGHALFDPEDMRTNQVGVAERLKALRAAMEDDAVLDGPFRWPVDSVVIPEVESTALPEEYSYLPQEEMTADIDLEAVAPPLLMHRFETFLLDMDGVLWEGGEVLPGAIETVKRLQKEGKRLLFVTNNSARSRKQVADKVNAFGFGVSPDDIVTSGWAAAQYLLTRNPPVKCAYLIGSEGLRDELQSAGITCVDDPKELNEELFKDIQLNPQVGAVVSGVDFNFSWSKLAAASAYVQRGALFVGTNPDNANRAGGLLVPENGAQLAAIEAASQRKATVVGKPSKLLVEIMAAKYGLDASTTIMIGDRLDTDVSFGNAAGLSSALVLTGVTTRDDIEAKLNRGELVGDVKPNFVMDSIESLVTGRGAKNL